MYSLRLDEEGSITNVELEQWGGWPGPGALLASLLALGLPILHLLVRARGGLAGFAKWYFLSLIVLLVGNLVAVPAAAYAFPRASQGRGLLFGIPTAIATSTLLFLLLPLLGSLVAG